MILLHIKLHKQTPSKEFGQDFIVPSYWNQNLDIRSNSWLGWHFFFFTFTLLEETFIYSHT